MKRTGCLRDVFHFVRLPWDWGQLDDLHQLEPLHLKLEKLKKLEKRKRLQKLRKKREQCIHR